MKLLRRYKEVQNELRLNKELTRRSDIDWSRLQPSSAPLYDAGSAQVGNLLFIFGGYLSLDEVSDKIRVFDLERELWLPERVAVDGLAQSHTAIATDGKRFIYIASGQFGPQCRPAIPDVWSYDVVNDTWQELPALPAPRYAGTMQLWRGHLHFVGGALQDRWTPADDHWSLKVSDGVAEEKSWRERHKIPVGGMHRGSAIVENKLFVLGGQQGDFVAKAGDPNCKCDGRTQETYLPDCFRLDEPNGDWVALSDMPIPASHSDFSIQVCDEKILVIGGQIYKDPTEFYLRLTDAIQEYDPAQDRWAIAGYMPYPLKLPVTAVWNDAIVAFGGQRNRPDTDKPGKVSDETWKGRLLSSSMATVRSPDSSSFFNGRSILLISHDLSRTGAPLLLIETARLLLNAGASVRLASVGHDTAGWSVASELHIPVVPIETAGTHAKTADFVIANTVSKPVMDWVRTWASSEPNLTQKLICWVHEINTEAYLPAAAQIKDAGLIVFDSHACQSAWVEKLGPLSQAVVVHPAVSDETVTKLQQEKQRFPRVPWRVNSEVDMLTRAQIRARLGASDSDFLVLCIGTIEPRKGQKLLLETVAELAKGNGPSVKLVLLGFKHWRRRARFMIKMTSAERQVLSRARCYVQQKDITAFYTAADAFVMNSQGVDGKSGECFGRVTIEAMAAGCAVLGTNAGGTAEIIEDNVSGILFPVGREGQKGLAGAIENLIRTPEHLKELQQEGRQRASDYFSEKRFFRDFENGFQGEGSFRLDT